MPLQVTETESLSVIPYTTPILSCNKPKQKALSDDTRVANFSIDEKDVGKAHQLTHFGWLVASVISRLKYETSSFFPGWSGYNSLLSESKSLTNNGVLPLLPEVAHEWPTLLTVISQAHSLKQLVVGQEYLTVISFDMALYEKAVQLIDSNSDLKGKVLPRLGELHTTMAALRALGSSIEYSGIDDAWLESNVYGSATIRQILKCTHYKRSIQAHIYTYMALYELVLEMFFEEYPHLNVGAWKAAEKVEEACKNVDERAESVKIANDEFVQDFLQKEFFSTFHDWKEKKVRELYV